MDNLFFEALKLTHEVVHLQLAMQNQVEKMKSLLRMGSLYNRMKEFDTAIEHYNQAIFLSKRMGYKQETGTALTHIGSIFDQRKQYEKAIEYYQQSNDIAIEMGARNIQAINLSNIAGAYQRMSNYKESMGFFEDSIVLARKVGNQDLEAHNLIYIGRQQAHFKQYTAAIHSFREGLELSKQTGNLRLEGFYHYNMGQVWSSLQKWELAEGGLLQAIKIFKSFSFSILTGQQLSCLAWVYAQQERFSEAWQMLAEAESFLQSEHLQYGMMLCIKAKIHHMCSHKDEALNCLAKVTEMAKKYQEDDKHQLDKSIRETRQFIEVVA